VNLNPKYERNVLIFGLLLGGLFGWFFGYLFECLAVFLMGYIVIQLSRLQTLYDWAQGVDADQVPFENGLLGQLARHIQQCKKQRIEQKESVKYQLERFKKLISVFPDGVVVLSLSNEIQWFNNQAARLLELEKRDTGQLINHLVRQPRFTQFLKHLPEEGAIVMSAPVAETNFSAGKVEIRILPYGDDERLLLVRDVTKVERTNQMRKDFVSNASHELRTPLTVMKGYVEILLSTTDEEDPKYSAPLKKVDQQVVKMQTMIEELLALSRLEEGKLEDSNRLVNVGSLCEQIKPEFETLAQKNGQSLVFNIAPTVNIKGNKASLLTVLRNLVANAVNYSAKDSEIHIGWLIDDSGGGVLFVKDAGKGIAARHLARLTERFYRVAENNIKNKTGTGLGLAIVKHELDRHEAYLIIESTLGNGSCFKCVFPASRFED
jgi:two-component system phosphate regulon sensor histidine kinase PhoR